MAKGTWASAKKDGAYNWDSMSIERAIEEALSFAGADNRDKNAITTKDVASLLIELGYPSDMISLGRKICEIAYTNEGAGPQSTPSGGRRRLTGATWIGARQNDEPWNRHQWALPMWHEVQQVRSL